MAGERSVIAAVHLRAAAIVSVLVSVLALTVVARAEEGTLPCPEGQTCAFPTPEECATGDHNGVWDGGGTPGRGSVCVGAGGHVGAYVGGEPALTCGTVIVADLNVVDGPTAGTSGDPNHCPYAGWPTEVHDPAVARERGTYFLFGTGPGIPVLRSASRTNWRSAGTVFPGALPSWASAAVPGTVIPWAPDISFFDGEWHLYYSISTFGGKRSAIGLATSPTLANATWTDRGPVVRSDDTTPYNAIDPNVIRESGGRVFLVFGSFHAGIQRVELDPTTGLVRSGASPDTIASRLIPTWGIEAPFVVRRAGYYYLFVSFDNCCRGSQSSYHIRVGRTASLDEPFVDDTGMPMLLGGGRLLLEGQGTRRGPGHNAVLRDFGTWRLFFHYYDAARGGTARLGIIPLTWTDDGWPVADWSSFGK